MESHMKKLLLTLFSLFTVVITVCCTLAFAACGGSGGGEESPAAIVLTFDANGGEFSGGANKKTVTANESGKVTFSEQPTCDGMEFKGWSKSSDNDQTKIIVLSDETFTDSATLYAVWQDEDAADAIVVTFDANGGEFSGGANKKTATVNESGKVTFLDQPTCNGKQFKGWSKSNDNDQSKIVTLSDEILTANTTYYAVWEDSPEYTQGLQFSPTGDGTGYSVSLGQATDKNVTVPAVYSGKPVIALDKMAFYQSDIEQVKLPDSIVSFGEYAFYGCNGLVSIQIPASVVSIAKGAFYECHALENVTFVGESKLNEFGLFVFCNCTSLKSAEIPAGVTVLPKQTFQGCINLQSVTYADGSELTEIGEYAFCDCLSLEKAYIPSGVAKIGAGAYTHCYSLGGVYISNLDGWCRIELNSDYETNPLNYANDLYADGQLVTQVDIPADMDEINMRIFYNCTSLEKITIPQSVTQIGESAFYECRAKIEWLGTPQIKEIGERAFYHYMGESIVIPDGVETIGESAFYGCRNITAITIPQSVTSIGKKAFLGCDKLIEVINLSQVTVTPLDNTSLRANAKSYVTEVTPTKLTVSGDYQFYDDGNSVYLVKYTGKDAAPILPNKFNGKNYEIFQSAFAGNNHITTMVIPDCVTGIGEDAFANCEMLNSVTIPASIGSGGIDNSAFLEDRRLVEVHNLSSTLRLEKGDLGNGRVAQYALNIYNTAAATNKIKTTSDGQFTYYEDGGEIYVIGYNGNDTAVTLPDQIEGRNYSLLRTFFNLFKIRSVFIPDGVKSIGDHTFYSCKALTKVNIPSSVSEIGERAFMTCQALSNIVIPDGVRKIGVSAFQHDALTTIDIPDSVTSIGSLSFFDCTKLTHVTIGSGLTELASDAFPVCKLLTSIEFSAQNTHFSSSVNGVVYDAAKTKIVLVLPCVSGALEIPEGVTAIPDETFSNCSDITSVKLPDSVQTIGEYAFSGCAKLESVEFGSNLKKISLYAFEDCNALTSASFKTTTGWKVCETNNISQGEDIAVDTPATNAENLTDSYSYYYWLHE